nr:gliding motility-associated C-terminal domain-containing protein [Saprospiraceae bacterium]
AFSFNNLSGEIPETIKNLTNLREYAVNYNNISGNIPSGFFSLQQLSGLWLHNNNLSGCFPNSLLNKCDSINYNFMNNPLLPWKGDLTPFCNGEIQIGSPCLIEGLEGEINESCECAEVMEDCMFSLLFDTLSILPFKQYDFNVLANDELPGNYTWELIKLPESVTIKDTDSIGNILFEVLENFLEPIVIEYEVCSDGCECRQSTFTIFNISIQQLTFTNIITPNGDGMDDVLRFTVEEIVKNSELWIYNRWGDRIFYMENYDNSWDASGYPGGIYFYVLRVNGVDIKKTLTIVK